MNNVVEIRNLHKSYGQSDVAVCAINGVDLSIEKNSFTAIVGRSGSGKSSLLNIIGGIEFPSSGEVLICGKNMYQMKDAERCKFRRHNIGYVFQFFNLIPELTVFENICLPAYLDHDEPDYALIEKIMDRIGIKPKHSRYPSELSGGEQQRVAIARALARKPTILLADEPTGNLDKCTGDELMSLLHFFHRDFEQTILLVTHDLEIARSCDCIITLDDGRIVSTVRCGGST